MENNIIIAEGDQVNGQDIIVVSAGETTIFHKDGSYTAGNWRSMAMDEQGNPVKRTKREYPYSYDGFVTYRFGENKEVNGTVYSDRLFQWDSEKYNRCCKEAFGNEGQYFYDRSAVRVKKFLRLYLGHPNLKLILIMEYCNASSGYPVWRFDYKI